MSSSPIYSAYGAHELKAKYQMNFLFGTGITFSAVLIILIISWIVANVGGDDGLIRGHVVKTIETVADLGPPPSIAKKPPQVKVENPNVAAPKVGIPKPVADDEVLDDDVVLATRDELADIVAPDIISDAGAGDIVIDIAVDDYLPSATEFVAVEIYPEMIYQHKPEYPRFAKNAGIEGTVWVQALVGKGGNVLKAQVYKSSGTPALDDAAVEAAKSNKFKPGIQNGRPVACWVSYSVDFLLTGQ